MSFSFSKDFSIDGSSLIFCLFILNISILLSACFIGLSCGADWFLIILIFKLNALNLSLFVTLRFRVAGGGDSFCLTMKLHLASFCFLWFSFFLLSHFIEEIDDEIVNCRSIVLDLAVDLNSFLIFFTFVLHFEVLVSLFLIEHFLSVCLSFRVVDIVFCFLTFGTFKLSRLSLFSTFICFVVRYWSLSSLFFLTGVASSTQISAFIWNRIWVLLLFVRWALGLIVSVLESSSSLMLWSDFSSEVLDPE